MSRPANLVGAASSLAFALLITSVSANSAAAVITLGDPDFTNGQVLDLSTYNAAQTGEPAPFNAFNGSDPTGPSFSASWTFTYSPSSVTQASITIGLYDHDSDASGNQVASFGVDGVDLTSSLNALLEASGGTQQEYNIYTVALGGAALTALSDGSATFSLSLQGPSLPNLWDTNGAGLDFATLNVPEPGTLALLGLGLAGLAASRRRKQ